MWSSSKKRAARLSAAVAFTLCAIAAGVVDPSPARADAWVKYEVETDALVTRNGGSNMADAGASAGNYWSMSAAGNYVSIACPNYTTGIRLYARTSSSGGIAEMSLDGGANADADTYSVATTQQVKVHEVTGLSATTHNLRASYSGRKNGSSSGLTLRLDFYECYVTDPPTTTTAAPTTTTTAAPSTVTYPCLDSTDRAGDSTTSSTTTSTTTPPTTAPCTTPCGYSASRPCIMAIGSHQATSSAFWMLGLTMGAVLVSTALGAIKSVRSDA